MWTLTRLYNLREGFDRSDDGLPEALTHGTDGGAESDGEAGDGLDPEAFEALLDRYYAYRGWDREGRPTAERLDRLDIADLPDSETPVGSAAERSDAGRNDD